MNKISLKARSIIRKGIASLLSSMGFFTLHASDKGDYIIYEPTDSIKKDYLRDSSVVVLYGCPYADFKINGHVTDKSGKPLENVEIQISQCDNITSTVTSDADGAFSIEYEMTPWCDIKISAKNDYSSACDSILEADYKNKFVITSKTGPFYYGVYSETLSIVLDENGELGKIIFGNVAEQRDAVVEKVLLFSNPVENYLWFNLEGTEEANVAIYNFSGEKVISATVSNGGNLYVGDLTCGNYIVTVASGNKKYVAKFLKK